MSRVKVCYWNAQGLWSKLQEFLEMLRVESIDIACICETHFTDNTPPLIIPEYHIIRQDRPTHMGGLITLVRKTIKFRDYLFNDTTLLEHSAILVCNKAVLINTYLPGGARRPDIQANLKNDLKILLPNTNSMGFFMLGDINAKNKYWNNLKNNAAGNILLDYCQNSGHTICFTRDPTYVPVSNQKSPSTIDLLITNNVIHNSRPYTKNTLSSDHVPVIFSIDLDIDTGDCRRVNKRNLHKANWNQFRYQLNSQIFNTNLYESSCNMNINTIDRAVESITSITKEAYNKGVPIVNVSKCGEFISKNVRDLIKERNFYRRRWLRSHRTDDKINYKSLTHQINYLIKTERCDKINNVLKKCTVGDNKIYKIIKNKRKIEIPPLIGENNIRIYEDQEKARFLAEHFRRMHNNTMAKEDIFFTLGVDSHVANIVKQDHVLPIAEHISSREVYGTIKNLKNGKAPGPDNIPVSALKNFSYFGCQFLTNIFNSCLKMGYFPQKWKIACTVAVHKQGKDPNLPTSYRPIALLCLFSRVFERILNKRVIAWANRVNALPDFQYGFRAGHSVSHALLSIKKCIKFGFDEKKTTGVLSFDIEKAFDRVWHNGLIYKMEKLKYPLYILKIVKSFLSNRFFYVRVGEATSDLMDIPWGVPQGSALSPTLYNLYISDMPRTLAENTQMKQYADDTVVHTSDRLIKKVNKRLQESAEIITKFYHRWKIKINSDKTILTCFTNRKTKQLPEDTLSITNADIPWSYEMKYLGVTFDKHLTLTTNTNLTCNKVDTVVRCLYPYINRNSAIDFGVKIHIYKTYIRPLLTYASPLTYDMSKTNMLRLERKQTTILRMMLDVSWEDFISNQKVLEMAKVPYLKEFIYKANETFFNKCHLSENVLIRELSM